jgi:hypothetical protein
MNAAPPNYRSPLLSPTRGVALAILLCSMLAALAHGEVYRLRGTGTLAGTGLPFGMAGEMVTITMDIDSEQLAYDATGSPTFRNFDPQILLPVSVVGATSGTFPDIDPVSLLRTVDAAAGMGADRIEISSGVDPQLTNILGLNCAAGDCFDSMSSPTSPLQFLTTLDTAIDDTNMWAVEPTMISSSAGAVHLSRRKRVVVTPFHLADAQRAHSVRRAVHSG